MKLRKNLVRSPFLISLTVILGIMFVSAGYAISSRYDVSITNKAVPSPSPALETIAPTQIPPTATIKVVRYPTQTTKAGNAVYLAPTTNADPAVHCSIHPDCGGGTTPLKQSECDQMTCCRVSQGGDWKFITKSECSRIQGSGASNNQPTSEDQKLYEENQRLQYEYKINHENCQKNMDCTNKCYTNWGYSSNVELERSQCLEACDLIYVCKSEL